MKKCNYCAEEIEKDLEYCVYCNHKVLNENEKPCIHCGEIIKKDAIYCRFCNKNLNAINGSLDLSNNLIDNNLESVKSRDNLDLIDKLNIEENDNFISNLGNENYIEEIVSEENEEFDIVNFLLSFKGRVTIKEYWLYYLVIFLTIFLVLIFSGVDKMSKEKIDHFSLIVGLIIFYPNLAVTVKRIHDFNYTGFLSLLTILPYGIGFIFIIGFGLIKGDDKKNQFGYPKKKVKKS